MIKSLTLSLPLCAALLVASNVSALSKACTARGADKYTINTALDTADANPADGVCADLAGNCSIRAAIQTANARTAAGFSRASLLRLQPKLEYALTLTNDDATENGDGDSDDDDDMDSASNESAASGDIDVNSFVCIKGKKGSLRATGIEDRLFDVGLDGRLEINRLDLIGGVIDDGRSGGAIQNAGRLVLERTTVALSSATGDGASGGAIFNNAGVLRVSGSAFLQNFADRAGGAIENLGGTVRILNTEFNSNQTGDMPGNGGALHTTGEGNVRVLRSKFFTNSAASEGGALWNSGVGSMRVVRSEFNLNSANGMDSDNGGGAIFNDGGLLIINRSDIERNFADLGSGSGGAILNNGGVLRISRSDINENSSARAGGGIEVVGGDTSIRRSRLNQNRTGNSPGNGGALHITGEGAVSVRNVNVAGNIAGSEGGGLWNSGSGTLSVRNSKILQNSAGGNDADQGGAGLFNDGGDVLVRNTVFSRNVATGTSGSGGAILNNEGSLTVRNSTLRRNQSARAGGGIESVAGNVVLQRVILALNTTGLNPGNGGALHLTGAGNVEISGGRIVKNSAVNEGGGLWNSATGVITASRLKIQNNTSPLGVNSFNDGGSMTVNGQTIPNSNSN